MADEPTTHTEAGEIEQIDDLSQVIYGAIDGDDDTSETVEAEASERPLRDEQGRFKAAADDDEPAPEVTEDEPEAAAPDDQGTELEASDGDTADQEPERPAWDDGHFRGWEPDTRERFEALSPDQQTAVMEFKSVSDAALTRTAQEFAEYRNRADSLVQAADEVYKIFAASNMTPDQALKGYAGIEQTLAYGTLDQKYQLIGQIAQMYGIPLDISQAVPLDADIDQLREVHDRDSRLAQEQSRIAQLEAKLESYEQQQLQSQISQFAAATNPDGSPKHPHFEMVKGAMGQYLAAGLAQSLDDAYEMAAKPYEDRIAAEIEARLAKTTASQREAVEKAKRAAPVKRSPPSALNGHTAAPPSLDDAISQALDSAGF